MRAGGRWAGGRLIAHLTLSNLLMVEAASIRAIFRAVFVLWNDASNDLFLLAPFLAAFFAARLAAFRSALRWDAAASLASSAASAAYSTVHLIDYMFF